MTGSHTHLPPILPSRRKPLQDAIHAVQRSETVFIAGAHGSGRTTFALSIFGQLNKRFYWVTGAAALHDVPFALLTGLCSQISQIRSAAQSPTSMISALTGLVATEETYIFLDRAEEVDEQSAAVLAQLATSEHLRLVVAGVGIQHLPGALQNLSARHISHRLSIAPMDFADAQFMVSRQLGGKVNAPSIRRLLRSCAGNPLYLRELVDDALETKELRLAGEYWTLHPLWEPKGERMVNQISGRLAQLPANLRVATAKLSITGTLPISQARMILGSPALDAMIDEGLAELDHNGPLSTGAKLIRLTDQLPAASVTASLDRAELRAILEHLLPVVADLELSEYVRANITVHCQAVGIESAPDDLLRAVTLALSAQRYAAVLTLTEYLDPEQYSSWKYHQLIAARATALHESGASQAALTDIETIGNSACPVLRLAGAQIRLTLGEVGRALELLQPLPEDPRDIAALRLIVENANEPTEDFSRLLQYATDPEVAPNIQAQALARYCVNIAFRGSPSQALDLLIQRLTETLSDPIKVRGFGHIFVALHPVMLLEGGAHHDLISMLIRIEDQVPLVNSARYFLARGSIELDQGHASKAIESFAQAMSLAQWCDPDRVWCLIAALRARAEALVGNFEQMRDFLDISKNSASTGGRWLHLETERALMPVILLAHGPESAREHTEQLLSKARARDLRMLQLRVQHDAWRLKLHDETLGFSVLASEMEGELARTLAGYTQALSELDSELDALVQSHVDQGRLLYAAELANHGSELALARGKRARSSQLLTLSTRIMQPLTQVNSPRLGRARVNPQVLTDREYAACSRAARGESNTVIAEALFLSPRTVEGHLQKSYGKLGIRDRRQLIEEPDGSSSV